MYNRPARPLGITIIATLMLVFSLITLCGSVAALGFSPFKVFDQGLGAVFVTGWTGLFGLTLSLANLAVAIGLLRLESWAFWATAIVELLSLINAGFSGGLLGTPRICGGVHLIPLLVLIYLFVDGNVRRAFRT